MTYRPKGTEVDARRGKKRALILVCVALVGMLPGLATAACARNGVATPTPGIALWPFSPMFTLTPFEPTATLAVRPIPPLPPGVTPRAAGARPVWIEAVSPLPGGRVPIGTFRGICIEPAGTRLDLVAPQLVGLFRNGERLRDHLHVKVNGVVPSELTWQNVIVANSTHPGTAWVGTRSHKTFCWTADLAPGTHEIELTYPTETGDDTLVWSFTLGDSTAGGSQKETAQ